MIDRRELLEKARRMNLGLRMVEKDYILGWLLFGLARDKDLVFKGGTALSKVYFPNLWRLSEDLDFSLVSGALETRLESIEGVLAEVRQKSGLDFALKSSHINPDYLQLKIQYKGVMDSNWVKVDMTLNDVVDTPIIRAIPRGYSDYIFFYVQVESPEEIFASKIRAVIERKKCRDFYDLNKLVEMDFDKDKIRGVCEKKLAVKSLELRGLDQIFPNNLEEILEPYWQRELGRLVNPVPGMRDTLRSLRVALKFLVS